MQPAATMSAVIYQDEFDTQLCGGWGKGKRDSRQRDCCYVPSLKWEGHNWNSSDVEKKKKTEEWILGILKKESIDLTYFKVGIEKT